MKIGSMKSSVVVIGALVAGSLYARRGRDETRVEVVFSLGHETERRDGGRPVALIAGALGVRPVVFREAFSHVTPSRNGPPDGELARRNKAALLGPLSRYGVTNERLDEVSDHYRYRPQDGELWPTKAARAYAIIEKGRIVRFEIGERGWGYSSTPTARVPGYGAVKAKLHFDKRFEKNGSVESLSLYECGLTVGRWTLTSQVN